MRIYFDGQMRFANDGSNAPAIYNMPLFIHITGHTTAAELSKSVSLLVERLQALRTVLNMDTTGERGLLQRVLPAAVVPVLERKTSSEAELTAAQNEFSSHAFNLS